MRTEFPKGVYPVMLTPFTEDNKVDYESLGRLIEWYIDAGVAGLFAICGGKSGRQSRRRFLRPYFRFP